MYETKRKHCDLSSLFINPFSLSFLGMFTDMKEKIINDAMKWYETQGANPSIEDFIDIVINKTTESIIEQIQQELEQEFSNGNLKHPFYISDEYYLELKLKDIKNKCLQLTDFYQKDE